MRAPIDDRDAGELAVVELALARRECPIARLQAERLESVDDRLAAPDRARRPVEGGEEAVAGGVALLPAEPAELAPHERVVTREQVAPGASPSSAACSVEPTMSVNITVASTLSGTAGGVIAGDEPLDLVDDLGREEDLRDSRSPLTCIAAAPGIRDATSMAARPAQELGRGLAPARARPAGFAQVGLVERAVERVRHRWAGADAQRSSRTSAAPPRRMSVGHPSRRSSSATPACPSGRGDRASCAADCQGRPARRRTAGMEQRKRRAYAPGRSRRTAPPSRSPRAKPKTTALRRVRSVEHRAQVLHPRLERRELAAVVGQPRAALVEQDQPKRPRQPQVEVAPARILPPVDEIRHVIGHVHEVGVSLAHDLVGDRDTAATRIPDLTDRHAGHCL